MRHLLLSHIHLDHAGAAGVLVREHPGLQVHVSEIGAPHLVDPSRLERSARRLYGDDFDRSGASSRLCPRRTSSSSATSARPRRASPPRPRFAPRLLPRRRRTLYAGDAAGVRIQPSASCCRRRRRPRSISRPGPHARRDRAPRARTAGADPLRRRRGRRAAPRGAAPAARRRGRARPRGRERRGVRAMAADDLGRRRGAYEQAMPFWQSYAGLKRYWENACCVSGAGAAREREFRLLFAGRTSRCSERVRAGRARVRRARPDRLDDRPRPRPGRALVPQLLFLLFGGILADRLPRHRVMVVSNVVRARARPHRGAAADRGHRRDLAAGRAAAVTASAMAFFFPASRGCPADGAGPLLQQANALLGLAKNGTSIFGAALGGVLVATAGPGVGARLRRGHLPRERSLLAAMRLKRAERLETPSLSRAGRGLERVHLAYVALGDRAPVLVPPDGVCPAHSACSVQPWPDAELGGPKAWGAILTGPGGRPRRRRPASASSPPAATLDRPANLSPGPHSVAAGSRSGFRSRCR